MILPKETDDTFGRWCDEETQREFQQSLSPDEKRQEYYHNEQRRLHKYYLYQEKQQQIQLRRETQKNQQKKQQQEPAKEREKTRIWCKADQLEGHKQQ